MKRILLFSICCAAAVCILVTPRIRSQNKLKLRGYTTVRPIKGITDDFVRLAATTPTQIPLWNYSVAASSALGGGTFTGTMIGRSPFSRGKTTTTVNLQIIPLKITIGGVVYDPTAANPCVPQVFPGANGNLSSLSVIQSSPLFTNNTYIMNGVNVGNTQYVDAFRRASFWSLVQGTPYHLLFNTPPPVLATQSISFSSPNAGNISGASSGGCESLGLVDIAAIDAQFQTNTGGPGPIITALAGQIAPGTFPMFLTRSVMFTDGPPDLVNFSNCCILGYHSGFTTGPNLQIYSPFSLDTTGLFGGDVETLSHEIAEAVDDPTGNNATPLWGQVGQVLVTGTPSLANGGCQNNLEVGDPLSDNGGATPTNAFAVPASNGITYHVQELAFFSWFFGGSSLGPGGKYSTNGSFSGPAVICPPGGFH